MRKLVIHILLVACALRRGFCLLDLGRRNKTELFRRIISAECPDFGDLTHGSVSKINSSSIQAVHIECDEGYDLIGGPKVLCNDGRWDAMPRPSCAKRCRSPPYLRDGAVSVESRHEEGDQFRHGTKAVYSCSQGFQLSPASSRVRSCQDGVWTGLPATCVSNGCPPPPSIANGYHVMEQSGLVASVSDGQVYVPVEQRVHYNCNMGYTLQGPASLQCIASGTWNPRQPPKCVRQRELATERTPQLDPQGLADELPPVEGGLETAIILGHMPASSPPLPPPVCPPAPATRHTQVSALGGPQTANNAGPGARLEVKCREGYRDIEAPCVPALLYCERGSWTGRLPDCVPVSDCPPPPDVMHGKLAPPPPADSSYPIGSTVSYACETGYLLDGEPTLTCSTSGCWEPVSAKLPSCVIDPQLYDLSASSVLLVSLAVALGVSLILLVVCVVVVCRHRTSKSGRPGVASPSPSSGSGRHRRGGGGCQLPHHSSPSGGCVATSGGILHDPDRVALIAFADGMQLGESTALPSYEEAVRGCERGSLMALGNGSVAGSGGGQGHRGHSRGHWTTLGSARRPVHVTRQSSSTSHTASLRSGSAAGDSMGSTDTMTPSEVSTTVTLDTVSSHTCSSGGAASCRAICGSLASFDTSSALNTEGVPLLEESELEEAELPAGPCKRRRASPEPPAPGPGLA